MTVGELKEKLNQFDDNLVVLVPNMDFFRNFDMCYIPATHISQGINELDDCVIIDDYVEED